MPISLEFSCPSYVHVFSNTQQNLTRTPPKQLSSRNVGMEELWKIDDETKAQMIASLHDGMDANENQQKLAEVHFEAWMRQLDAKVKLWIGVSVFTIRLFLKEA